MIKWVKQHIAETLILSVTFLVVSGFGLLFTTPLSVSELYHASMSLLNVENCEPVRDYMDDVRAIYDDDLPEGTFEQVSEGRTGKSQNCFSYRQAKGFVRIIEASDPPVMKVGTKKYKDPALLALAASAGIRQPLDKEPVSIYYVDNYTDFVWAAGQYSDFKKAITVRRGAYLEQQHVTLAHEYLHYVWYRDKLDEDQQLVAELTAFYQRSYDLQQRMTSYTPEMTIPTEFFSYGCTEWSSARLSSYIVEKCNQYVDRSKLPLHY